jgi:hypothetical protein
MAFLAQNRAKLCKNLITALVFEKNSKFFAENRQKSQKIVIITSTPGTYVIICKIFSLEKLAKNLLFCS